MILRFTRNSFYLWFYILTSICFFFYSPIHVSDLAVWVALGRDSILQHTLITKDPYTITQTQGMVYPFVLSWFYGLLYQIGGLKLVSVLHALIPAVWVALWWKWARRLGESKNGALPFIFGASLLGTTLMMVARPALIATIPLLLSYTILADAKDSILSRRQFGALVALGIFWVNVHGSFPMLLLMIGWQMGYFLWNRNDEAFRNRIALVFAIAISFLANPFGWRVYPYVMQTVFLSKKRGLEEWFAPHHFYYPFASAYFYGASVIAVFALVRALRKFPGVKTQVIFDPIIVFWISGFFATRNTYIAFLLLPIFVLNHFRLKVQWVERKSVFSGFGNDLIVMALVFLVFALNPYVKPRVANFLPENVRDVFSREDFIPETNAYLNAHLGRIFNDWDYGSELALEQRNPFFIDTRNVIFSDETDQAYDRFILSPEQGWDQISSYDFKYFLLSSKHPELIRWVEGSNRFHLILREDPASLYELK